MSAHKTRTQSMAICWLLGATLAACGGATSDDNPMDTDAPGDNSPGNADTGNADTGSGLQAPSQDAGGAPAPEPTGPARYTQISANNGHTCALTTAGGIRCWGENDFGESDAPNGEGFVHVSAGTQHSCAIRDDGSVECWGDRPSIGRTPEGSFVQLSASLGATCAIRDDATLHCWGTDRAESDGLLEVPEGSYTWVSTSGEHGCAVATDQSIRCWGSTTFGKTMAPQGRFTEVHTTFTDSCALDTEGKLQCWGALDFWEQPPETFQSATGTTSGCGLTPEGEAVCEHPASARGMPAGPFTQLAAGGGHICGLRPDGSVVCWGESENGKTDVP